MEDKSHRFSLFRALFMLVIVLVVAAAASFGVYVWQHDKVKSQNDTISSLNAQIAALNNQVATLSTQVNKTCQGTATPTCAGYTYSSLKGVKILVFMPAKNSTLTSPVAVIGEVPGNWSFEAQFPLQLKSDSGGVIASTTAHLLDNWQTSELVPFSAQLTFSTTGTSNGTLQLQKDNPSGLASNDDSLSIPVKF